MPYQLTYSLGNITVPDQTLNTQTSISLPGINFPAYGVYVDQNQVTMMEHFASSNANVLANAIPGQIWYDRANGAAKINTSANATPVWTPLVAASGNVTLANVTITNATITTANITTATITTANITNATITTANITTINNVTTISTGANTTGGVITGAWTLSPGSTFQATYA
jgi:hypothetical protein